MNYTLKIRHAMADFQGNSHKHNIYFLVIFSFYVELKTAPIIFGKKFLLSCLANKDIPGFLCSGFPQKSRFIS
jgi:hypothetical protein